MTGADKYMMFRNRLQKVYRHLSKLARSQGVSCYRLYDRDLPEFPLVIDYYEGKVSVAEYISKHGMDESQYQEWLEKSCEVIRDVLIAGEGRLYLRTRKRKQNRFDQYLKSGEDGDFFIASENQLKFKVNLSDYLDTGLFLDHRITRRMVRQESGGKRVLNLFCYTGAFSVYAAAGGAGEVVSVDLSNTYLKWAMENMKLNGFSDANRYRFIRADVLALLEQSREKDFDLVILDPPTFSNSKKMKGVLDIQRDHVKLINSVFSKMRKGGHLYFSTNYRRFQLMETEIAASRILDITRATTPFDFKGKLQRWCYLLEK